MSTTSVSSGVTSSGLTESGAGNTLEVLNGGSAVSITAVSGGFLQVDSGGARDQHTYFERWLGELLSDGTADHMTVSSGGGLPYPGLRLAMWPFPAVASRMFSPAALSAELRSLGLPLRAVRQSCWRAARLRSSVSPVAVSSTFRVRTSKTLRLLPAVSRMSRPVA